MPLARGGVVGDGRRAGDARVGANLGGWLTAALGLGAAWESARGEERTFWRRVGTWLAAGVAAALAVMWVDSWSASPSHLGETWLRWRAEGARRSARRCSRR